MKKSSVLITFLTRPQVNANESILMKYHINRHFVVGDNK